MKFTRSNYRFGTALALAFLFLVAVNTQAKNRSYETGKLVYLSATPINVPIPLPDPHGGTLMVPLTKNYGFTIESVGNAHMGMCFAKGTKYLPEWTTGETIEYRIEKNRIFLKRHNNKEQILLLQLQGKDQRSMTSTNPGKKQEVPECTK